MAFGRKKASAGPDLPSPSHSAETDRTLTTTVPYGSQDIPKPVLKRATRTRKAFAVLTSLCLLVSVVFMVLVEIGNTYDRKVLTDIYFLRIDLTNVVPSTVPNARLLNSIARTLGLHDFYTAGLWGFCEGYNDEGTTFCSKPQTFYWFNPVEILLNELLAGATIALPAELITYLKILKTAYQWMFGFFLSGTCLAALLIPLTPLSVFSRLTTLPIALFTFLAALLITVATVLATVMFVIIRNAVTGVAALNIGATLGLDMFVFMWIAAGSSLVAALVQLGLCCCCASRRDVRTGRKRGSRKAWEGAGLAPPPPPVVAEKKSNSKQGRSVFGRKKAEV
ncbi:hypothetical protein LTR04_006349 [Oleoguttula sp. CCFEE 6159]|nr:hypothetical protein LTR04_006349 [Oleoguttula sp. CCFEE 6159]